jgi:Cdc6-like AAA superfamily ATPase
MALEKGIKIATVYDVPEKVDKQQRKVEELWEEFDKWWRKKYHYHTMDPIGAVKLWYEFINERSIKL